MTKCRLLALIILILVIIFVFCGCSKDSEGENAKKAADSTKIGDVAVDTTEKNNKNKEFDAGDTFSTPNTSDSLQNDANVADIFQSDSSDVDFSDSDAKKPIDPLTLKCIDKDGDYYGKYCGWGTDCDDTNPNFNTYCPDCTKTNHPGCPCLSAKTTCFSADLNLVGVGICKTGVQECKGGFWKQCVGEVIPEKEYCDSVDNNCNGVIDEGVKSTCNNCDFGCFRETAAPKTDNALVVSDFSKNIKLDKDGNVVLKDKKAIPIKFSYIWIANSQEATVSKLNTKTGAEVARYKACADPSRTAVDLVGDVWVACRGDGGVMKIAGSLKNCKDTNGNAKIDTSEDKNKNKKIELGEMLPYLKDECVRFIVYPEGKGNWTFVPRAAGVDKDNYGWIGFWKKEKLIKLHPQTGKKLDSIPLKCNPYGLAIDKNGIIWIAGRGCDSLLRVDPKTKKVDKIQYSEGSPYGMTIDSFGNIWVANTAELTSRYNPQTKKWTHVKHGFWSRGVASSKNGYVYVALDSSNSVAKINAKTMKLEKEIFLGNNRYPVGIAVDHDGFVWAINQFKNSATKIDPIKEKIIAEYPVGNGPYTYSDMTGYALLNYTLPSGYYVHSFGLFVTNNYVSESKSVKKWDWIDITAQFPKNSYILMYYKAGYTPTGMKNSPWSGPFGPFPSAKFPINIEKDKVTGFYLQVKVVLHAGDDKKSPVIEKITVQSHVIN